MNRRTGISIYPIRLKSFRCMTAEKMNTSVIQFFGDPYMISVLEGSKFWLVDGTLGYLKTSTKFTLLLV